VRRNNQELELHVVVGKRPPRPRTADE
jgi:hypothetical protein